MQQVYDALNNSNAQQPASYAAHRHMLTSTATRAVVYSWYVLNEDSYTPHLLVRYLNGDNGITAGWATTETVSLLEKQDIIPFEHVE